MLVFEGGLRISFQILFWAEGAYAEISFWACRLQRILAMESCTRKGCILRVGK